MQVRIVLEDTSPRRPSADEIDQTGADVAVAGSAHEGSWTWQQEENPRIPALYLTQGHCDLEAKSRPGSAIVMSLSRSHLSGQLL